MFRVQQGAHPMLANRIDDSVDLRRAARHRANLPVIMEMLAGDEQQVRIVNVSAHGFMVEGELGLARGDRVVVRLPVIGRIEAHMVWSANGKAGFQLERVIRLPDFMKMLEHVNPRG
jgi:hypothetical protein